MSSFARPSFLGVVLLLSSLAASATVVVMPSLERMAERADVIVHARVAEQRVVREATGITTLTDIEVIDGIKGAKDGDVLTIYQPGGTLDGEHAWISGAHKHVVGEEMVLFAVHHVTEGHGARIVSYGVGIGKFRVERDGTMPRAVEDIGDVVVMKRDEAGQPVFTPPEPRAPETLDAFKERVRRMVLAKVPDSGKRRPPVKRIELKSTLRTKGQ